MFQSIEEIRNKPERTKRNITLVVTIVIFVVIVFVWISLLSIDRVTNTEKVLEQEALSPISVMKDSFSSIFDDAKVEVEVLKEQLNNS